MNFLKGGLAVVTVTIVLNSISFADVPPALPQLKSKPIDPVIKQLMKLQNAERARYGIAPVKMHPKMNVQAQKHAEWMADTGWYQHSALPWMEIIYYGPRRAEDAINGWIWSRAHHGIMLSGRQAGYGYVVDERGAYWVVVVK
ncbi:MAG: hypothetical protein CMJ78_08420 [Planctomycetaceae bacterium]|nr:hypothetical protein [Planctomycetaceae bacterium]